MKKLTIEQRDWLYEKFENLIKHCIEDEEDFISLGEVEDTLNQGTEEPFDFQEAMKFNLALKLCEKKNDPKI